MKMQWRMHWSWILLGVLLHQNSWNPRFYVMEEQQQKQDYYALLNVRRDVSFKSLVDSVQLLFWICLPYLRTGKHGGNQKRLSEIRKNLPSRSSSQRRSRNQEVFHRTISTYQNCIWNLNVKKPFRCLFFVIHFPFHSNTAYSRWPHYKKKNKILDPIFPPLSSFLEPIQQVLFAGDLLLQLENSIKQRFSSWRTPGDVNINRNNSVTTTYNCIRVVIVAASIRTGSHWKYVARFGHLFFCWDWWEKVKCEWGKVLFVRRFKNFFWVYLIVNFS